MNLDPAEMNWHSKNFNYTLVNVASGLNYLGYHIKPNDYLYKDWAWMLARIEKWLMLWHNKWISHGRILTLINAVIEAIPVYWFMLYSILVGTLRRI